MGRGKRLGPLKKDKGKVVRGDDGKAYRLSQVLACMRTGERSCWGQVHRIGRVHFSGRAFDAMPRAKFQHCTSKFFRGEVPWEARVVQVPMRAGSSEAAAVAAVKATWKERHEDEPHARAVEEVGWHGGAFRWIGGRGSWSGASWRRWGGGPGPRAW